MEDLQVPDERDRARQRAARAEGPTPGRQTETVTDRRDAERDKAKRKKRGLKQLFGRREQPDDDRGEKPDTALILNLLSVPPQLQHLPSQVLLAESLAHALFAVKDLKNPETGSQKYNAGTFTAEWLSYQHRPLLHRDEWEPLLSAFLFEVNGEQQASDLAANGFDRAALAAIWARHDDTRSAGGTASGDIPSALQQMIDRIWQRIYVPQRWHRRSLGEIAQLIYAHGYLGAKGETPEGRHPATRGDATYWRTLPREVHADDDTCVADRREGDSYDVGEFYYLGKPIQTTYRIYLHAKPELVGAITRLVKAELAEYPHAWCAKVVSPAEATFRPDTIVLYTSDPERDSVEKLAQRLAGSIAPRSLRNEIPGLAHLVAPGIATAWGPDSVVKNHSFGSYCAGILAEAFHDVVASMRRPTKTALMIAARYQFGRYGLKPDDPAHGPAKLADERPPSPCHVGLEDDHRERVFAAMARRKSDRTSDARPVGGVRVVPEAHLKLLPGAARNLNPRKPHNT